ncbi:hypothetical protein M404DRAFT_757844 [Pisolithus tinctorius Marx 270]|uniref:Uncharacterized protein n=1 Tax=Pisolithus tinctorius Marx 270 TaxID=870435 RepID=A0A0C3NZG9_PISTI|nr:hypothetical protein M404DRAFT_757844 [Pisolithus tinctorius Marx 270]
MQWQDLSQELTEPGHLAVLQVHGKRPDSESDHAMQGLLNCSRMSHRTWKGPQPEKWPASSVYGIIHTCLKPDVAIAPERGQHHTMGALSWLCRDFRGPPLARTRPEARDESNGVSFIYIVLY